MDWIWTKVVNSTNGDSLDIMYTVPLKTEFFYTLEMSNFFENLCFPMNFCVYQVKLITAYVNPGLVYFQVYDGSLLTLSSPCSPI